jgi:hypothetical protein
VDFYHLFHLGTFGVHRRRGISVACAVAGDLGLDARVMTCGAPALLNLTGQTIATPLVALALATPAQMKERRSP